MPFNSAVRLLARREHGEQELFDKLIKKGYTHTAVQEAIAECQRLGLQSDARYVDGFCRWRIRQGYGPLKIRQELQLKKIDRDLIEQTLEQEKDNWLSYALDVWQKKDKSSDIVDFADLQKRQRFLLYRGFPTDIIALIVRDFKTHN
jgi:regulatory protein